MDKNNLESLTMQEIANADQADRGRGYNMSDDLRKRMAENDEIRRKEVRRRLAEGLIITPEDKCHASLIFQHGGTLEDYKLANELAEASMNEGYERAKWLYAATLDRWLANQGELQKYGTQALWSKETGRWGIRPYDETTTDEERLKYNVIPIVKMQEFVDKLNRELEEKNQEQEGKI